ncbi:MAG: histidine kinase, partial [Saccharolobus sp.]
MQNLSSTQREILLALADLYNRHKRMIKSKEVAD